MKYCPKCKQDKKLDDFGNNKSSKDGKQRVCKLCQSIYDNKFYLNHKKTYFKQVQAYNKKKKEDLKIGYSCLKCNDKRTYCLDFHHIDPKTKKDTVSRLINNGAYKLVREEIKKCIVLCRNCHAEFHYLQRKNNITIKQYLKI